MASILSNVANKIINSATDFIKKSKNNTKESNNASNQINNAYAENKYTPLGDNNDSIVRYSNTDDYNQIQKWKQTYNEAQKNNDTALMEYAHEQAEDIRKRYNYSGGTDGSVYNKIANPYAEDENYNTVNNLYGNINKAYEEASKKSTEAINSGIQSTILNYENQIKKLENEGENQQRAAYVDYARKMNPYGLEAESLNQVGLGKSGVSETSRINAYNTYQNRTTDIINNIRTLKSDFDTKIQEAKLNGNVELAQLAQQEFNNKYNMLLQQYKLQQEAINTTKANEQMQLENQINTIGQYAEDYQAEINKREATNPNDPLIPYLKIARLQKIANQNTVDEDTLELALDVVDMFGYVTPDVHRIMLNAGIDIPIGTTSQDYLKTIYAINKPYSTKKQEKDDDVITL